MLGWALRRLRNFTITNAAGEPYLRRYYLVQTRWGSVYLHEIMRSDEDRDLHDHPWNFVSLVLRRGYTEHLLGGHTRYCGFSRVIFHRAEDAHKVELSGTGTTWTLVIVGRKRRDWGFVTSNGWVQHEQYFDQKYGSGKWVQEPEYQGLKQYMD